MRGNCFVVFLCLTWRSASAWTSTPVRGASKHHASSPLDTSSNTKKPLFNSIDSSNEETIGVAALLLSSPKSVVQRGKKRASDFIQNRATRWRIQRRRRQSGLIELSENEQVLSTSEDDVNVPDWACVDAGERQRLGIMKGLLKDDFKRLEHATVETENGSQVCVVDAFPDVYGDLRLLRYLRKDAIQNPESAAKRFRSFVAWRKDNDVDTVRWHVEKRPFSPPTQLNILRELAPCEFDVKEGGSQDTVPACVYLGQWQTAKITKLIQRNVMSVSCFMLYWTHVYESLNLKLHQEMMRRKRMVYIDMVADLQGLSMGHFSPGFFNLVLKPFIKVTQANYPETTKRIIFLSPPKVISVIWNIVAPLISPGTVAKVQFKRAFRGSCMDYVRETRERETTQ